MMKNLTKVVLSLTAIVLLSGVAIMAPRTVHAVAATLVSDVDNPARHPWSAICGGDAGAGSSVKYGHFAITAPLNSELVIQSYSVEGYSDTDNTDLFTFITTSVNGVVSPIYMNLTTNKVTSSGNQNSYEGSRTGITAYADPGTTVGCIFQTAKGNPKTPLSANIFLTGYVVTLPLATN